MFQHYLNKILEIKNPIHPGFYGSVLEMGMELENQEYNDNLELNNLIQNKNLEIEMDYNKYMQTATEEVNQLFIKLLNNAVNDIFNISGDLITHLEDSELISPKYYNYETDQSFLKVRVNTHIYERVLNQIFKTKKYYAGLSDLILQNHSSRPGFHSFYSNDITEWEPLSPYGFDYNHLSTITEYIISLLYSDEDVTEDLLDCAWEAQNRTGYYYLDQKGNKYYFHDLEKEAVTTEGV